MNKKLVLVAFEKEEFPHLGLGYIASYLRGYGEYKNVNICELRPGTIEEKAKQIKSLKPDIVGFTSVTYNFSLVSSLAEVVKDELSVPIFIGGHHITLLPQKLPEHFDFAVIGEGEETTLQIMHTFCRSEDGFSEKLLSKIKGIAFRDSNGQVRVNSPRELIHPLDRIPFPAWDLFDMDYYIPRFAKSFSTFENPVKNCGIITTSRGCPFQCIFCSCKSFWGSFRLHTPEYVLSTIESLLKQYPSIDCIHINDDLFVTNKSRLRRIAELIHEKGIDKKVKFAVVGHAKIFDEEIAQIVRSMNVFHIFFGFESGSDKILRYLKGDVVSVADNIKAVTVAKKYGFTVEGALIIGSPQETKEDLLKTYEFAEKYLTDTFGVQILIPFPGTKLWSDLENEGVVSANMEFNKYVTFGGLRDVIRYLSTQDDLDDKRIYDRFLILNKILPKKEFIEEYLKFYILMNKRKLLASSKLNPFSIGFWKSLKNNPTLFLRTIVAKLESHLHPNHFLHKMMITKLKKYWRARENAS